MINSDYIFLVRCIFGIFGCNLFPVLDKHKVIILSKSGDYRRFNIK